MNRGFGHAWAGLSRPQHQHSPGEAQPAGAWQPLGQVETWGETAAQDSSLPFHVQRYEHAHWFVEMLATDPIACSCAPAMEGLSVSFAVLLGLTLV